MSSYAPKKEQEDPTGVDTSNLVTKKYFIVWNAEFGKIDFEKLINIPSALNN